MSIAGTEPCPRCSGRGKRWGGRCVQCNGTGRVVVRRPVAVEDTTGDLFSAPDVPAEPLRAHARGTDPQESHAAARSVNKQRHLAIVRTLLADGPATYEELIARARAAGYSEAVLTDQSIRSRCSELRKEYGEVEKCGQSVTSTGSKCGVWRLVERKDGAA